MSQHDDFSQHLSDDEVSNHDDASDNGDAPKQQQQQVVPQITTISNIKLPILKKDEYDIWAMEMEHYLKYIDNEVWKERKARNILLMAIPKEHIRRFHSMDDAKEIWEAIKTRFGGNANLKKMQKALEAYGAAVSNKDANHKFLRSLPPAWSHLAITMRTKPEIDTLFIDDLYNNLRVFEQEIKGASKTSSSAQHVSFVSQSKHNNNIIKSGFTGDYSAYTPSTSLTNLKEREVPAGFADEVIYSLFSKQLEDWDLLDEDLEQIDDLDIEEMDINWQIAMIAIRMKKFYKKTGRRVRINGKAPVGFDKKKLEAHLEKKQTRLRTNTKILEDLSLQSLETTSEVLHDAVASHQVTASPYLTTASARVDSKADLEDSSHDGVTPKKFMMQRYVEDPSIDIPFIFDIDGRTLELGRQDFCLITGFRFGKISLDPKEKDRSQFRERVFPETPNLNGQLLLDLVKNDVAFNNLDDDDDVRVCLLLALDYVFMGQEIKHVLLKPIVNLVDNLSEWDKFPWGEYMWREFHKRVYNVVAKHREYHLKMLGNNPRCVANYALYGFVFPLNIWGLETFSNSIYWWRKDENVIPREVAWSNGLKFEKSNYEMMLYSPNASFQKLTPTSIEMNEPWLKSILEFFIKVTTPNPVTRGSSSSRSVHTCVQKEVRHEVHVRTKFHSIVQEEVCTQSVDKEDVPEIVVLEKNVKEQQMQIADMQRHRVVLDKIFKEQQLQILDMQRTGMEALVLKLVVLTTSQRKGPTIDLAEESESTAIDGLISLQSHDIHSQPFLSPSKVTELINELFPFPNDLGFSQANSIFGYVDVDNMDKDGCITDVKTVARPFLRQRRLADGNEITLLPWNEDLTRSPNAPKRSVSVPEEIMSLFHDKKKMEMQWTFPWLDDGYRIQMDF
ncbi:ribonuclease H-like domain-containing protein [Tanacetum coccineum]